MTKTFWERMKCEVGLMVDHYAAEEMCNDVYSLSLKHTLSTDHHSVPHSVTSSSDHTYWPHTSRCDKCMWPGGVVARCGHCVGHCI